MIPNMVPSAMNPGASSSVPSMPVVPQQCVPNYVNFQEQISSDSSPIVQLQNFGRNFENS